MIKNPKIRKFLMLDKRRKRTTFGRIFAKAALAALAVSAVFAYFSFYFIEMYIDESADREIAYLCNATPGNEYYVYREEGLKDIVKDIIELPSGIYQFSFTSRLKTNFGEKYLPLEAEVYLMNRSGRDETGYFAPLE